MGVSLRDTKQASAPSDQRSGKTPAEKGDQQRGQEAGRKRGGAAVLITTVSALVALLVGVGVVVFIRQSPGVTTAKTRTPALQPSAPITAVVNGRVMLDGASGWKDVSPAHFAGSDPVDAQFLTPTLGWTVDVQLQASNRTTKDFVVYHTADGGATWKSVTVSWLDEGLADQVQVQFVDAQHGFVSIALHPSTSRRAGFVYATSDGGASWTKHGAPFGGTIQFSSPTTGILIGGGINSSHNLIAITRDGGATWQDETLIAPTGFDLVDRYIATPAFAGQHGVMPVNYGTELAFYSSDDGGVSWILGATFPVATADREMWPVVSLFGHDGLAMVGSVLYATHDGGKTWAAVHASRNLAGVQALGVTGPTSAWALTGNATLLVTDDGGVTWSAAK